MTEDENKESEFLALDRVPQGVLDEVHMRYGGLVEGHHRFPRIHDMWWAPTARGILRRALALMQEKLSSEPNATIDHNFERVVSFDFYATMNPQEGLCNTVGNPVPGFHSSVTRLHYLTDMLTPIVIGFVIETGFIPRWGNMPFRQYFGYGRPSGTHNIGRKYTSDTRGELFLFNEDGTLKRHRARLYFDRFVVRPTRQEGRGMRYDFHLSCELGLNKEGQWAQRSEQYVSHVPDIPVPSQSPLARKT